MTAAPKPPTERREPEALEFPGCRSVRISREDIADCDIRFEYWDADTEIAMICEPVSYYHERPASRLARLADRIAAARGAPIEAVGHTDLLVRNARGEWKRIIQADQILFLRPTQALPRGSAIEVGADVLPDVVLEVNNTTDVRRGKLRLYESWGFPEVWVEVPDQPAPSRPASLRPGLTIHAMERGGLRPTEASRAFPGWTAQEIHRALNKPELSERTAAVLKRVGRAMGVAEGTGPHDDPFLRSERRESHAAGWAEGHEHGRAEALCTSAMLVLASRGMAVVRLAVREVGEARGSLRASDQCGVGMPGRGGLPAPAARSSIRRRPVVVRDRRRAQGHLPREVRERHRAARARMLGRFLIHCSASHRSAMDQSRKEQVRSVDEIVRLAAGSSLQFTWAFTHRHLTNQTAVRELCRFPTRESNDYRGFHEYSAFS